LNSPFLARLFSCGPMNNANQGVCQSQKTAKYEGCPPRLGTFCDQDLAKYATPELGTFTIRPALMFRKKRRLKESLKMIGKLFGAWLGEKVAGDRDGAKGAILGYGAAALAKRSVPALAVLALGGWAFKKWRGKRRAEPAYPSEASSS
jgi:hypothetical protein